MAGVLYVQSCAIGRLPVVIFSYSVSYLECNQLACCQRVSRVWRGRISQASFWHERAHQEGFTLPSPASASSPISTPMGEYLQRSKYKLWHSLRTARALGCIFAHKFETLSIPELKGYSKEATLGICGPYLWNSYIHSGTRRLALVDLATNTLLFSCKHPQTSTFATACNERFFLYWSENEPTTIGSYEIQHQQLTTYVFTSSFRVTRAALSIDNDQATCVFRAASRRGESMILDLRSKKSEPLLLTGFPWTNWFSDSRVLCASSGNATFFSCRNSGGENYYLYDRKKKAQVQKFSKQGEALPATIGGHWLFRRWDSQLSLLFDAGSKPAEVLFMGRPIAVAHKPLWNVMPVLVNPRQPIVEFFDTRTQSKVEYTALRLGIPPEQLIAVGMDSRRIYVIGRENRVIKAEIMPASTSSSSGHSSPSCTVM